MRLLVYADPHWCSYSSIVRSRGSKYSTRLENLIQSINWAESLAEQLQCDRIVCLGDFFDRAELNSEEITALQEVIWASMPHTFLVGNHEMGRSNLQFSSAHLFDMPIDHTVVDSTAVYDTGDGTQLCFLPYILESNRKPLSEYFPMTNRNRIIFSHNDIKDIQIGKFLSTEGFSVGEIEENCDLFVNGHLHNSSQIGNKIINLGNITGQNFSEDASIYKHYVLLIDTLEHKIEWIENPYALNFYKLDFSTYRDNEADARVICETIDSLGNNAVATIKILPENDFLIKDLAANSPNLIEYRILIDMVSDINILVESTPQVTVDHLLQFVDYIKSEVGSSKEIIEELDKIVEG